MSPIFDGFIPPEISPGALDLVISIGTAPGKAPDKEKPDPGEVSWQVKNGMKFKAAYYTTHMFHGISPFHQSKSYAAVME